MKKVKKVDEDLILKQNDDLINRLKTYFPFLLLYLCPIKQAHNEHKILSLEL